MENKTENSRRKAASPSFGIDSQLANDMGVRRALEQAGWKHEIVQEKGRRGYRPLFTAYTHDVRACMQGGGAPFPKRLSGLGHPISQQFQGGVKPRLGCPTGGLTPPVALPSASPTASTPSIGSISSILAMRGTPSGSFQLAYDTEFYYDDAGERYVLSYQFSFYDVRDPDVRHDVIVAPLNGRLRLGKFLSWAIKKYELYELPFAQIDKDGFTFASTRRWRFPYVSGGSVRLREFKSLKAARDYVQKTYPNGAPFSVKCHYHKKRREWVPEKMEGTDLGIDADFVTDDDIRKHFEVVSGKLVRTDASMNALPELFIGYVNDFKEYNPSALPVTLVAHAESADLTAFDFSDFEQDLLTLCSAVQGGLVTLKTPKPAHLSCLDAYWRFWPVRISVRDSLCYAPANKRSLAAIGDVVNVPKVVVSFASCGVVAQALGVPVPKDPCDAEDLVKEHMDVCLRTCPIEFTEYATQDAVVVLEYVRELWGKDVALPVTLTSASARLAASTMDEYFEKTTDGYTPEDFDRVYRGLHKVSRGKMPMVDRAAYIEDTRLEPISDDADRMQRMFQNSYHGGWNGSCVLGEYDGVLTHDVDLENAYLTMMALVPDPDWTHPNGCILSTIDHRDLTLQDFHTPIDLLVAYVRFEFPEDVLYPCIPVTVGSSLVYPRTSNGLDGVYACAPELYLALMLGATVHAVRGVVGRCKLEDNTPAPTVSRSLFRAVYILVTDRALAKRQFGKGSLAELTLKTGGNSLYGKTAQDVVEKSAWSAYKEEMVGLGGSRITSPVHAALITSGVRAVLLAALNELHALGYVSYSVTTDGFITNATLDVVQKLDLYGLSAYFQHARMALVHDPVMWSEKHTQSQLLNFTTRGNVSLESKGVCAHNSYRTSARVKDSYEDRAILTHVVLSRVGRVKNSVKQWVGFRKLSERGTGRKDFGTFDRDRGLHMDFDLKRKPLRDSMHDVTVTYDDPRYMEAIGNPSLPSISYEVANFDTVPFENVAEYERYRACADSHRSASKALRTTKDWDDFYTRLASMSTGARRHLKDIEWARLMTCVMGERLRDWEIPTLRDASMPVAAKCNWINLFNRSDRRFKPSDWKNARRPERRSQMLPRSEVADLLALMGAI